MTSIAPSPVSQDFIAASGLLLKAVDSLTFPPNARIDVRVAIEKATTQAEQATELLKPWATSGDQFTQRNATAAVAAATSGVSALNTARDWMDPAKDPSGPRVSISELISTAQQKFTIAEQVLWNEGF